MRRRSEQLIIISPKQLIIVSPLCARDRRTRTKSTDPWDHTACTSAEVVERHVDLSCEVTRRSEVTRRPCRTYLLSSNRGMHPVPQWRLSGFTASLSLFASPVGACVDAFVQRLGVRPLGDLFARHRIANWRPISITRGETSFDVAPPPLSSLERLGLFSRLLHPKGLRCCRRLRCRSRDELRFLSMSRGWHKLRRQRETQDSKPAPRYTTAVLRGPRHIIVR